MSPAFAATPGPFTVLLNPGSAPRSEKMAGHAWPTPAASVVRYRAIHCHHHGAASLRPYCGRYLQIDLRSAVVEQRGGITVEHHCHALARQIRTQDSAQRTAHQRPGFQAGCIHNRAYCHRRRRRRRTTARSPSPASPARGHRRYRKRYRKSLASSQRTGAYQRRSPCRFPPPDPAHWP